jgi:hypothetical protein
VEYQGNRHSGTPIAMLPIDGGFQLPYLAPLPLRQPVRMSKGATTGEYGKLACRGTARRRNGLRVKRNRTFAPLTKGNSVRVGVSTFRKLGSQTLRGGETKVSLCPVDDTVKRGKPKGNQGGAGSRLAANAEP